MPVGGVLRPSEGKNGRKMPFGVTFVRLYLKALGVSGLCRVLCHVGFLFTLIFHIKYYTKNYVGVVNFLKIKVKIYIL